MTLLKDRYLIRNMDAGFLGNSPIFWRENNSGYTQWINEAKLFTSEKADELVEENPRKWVKYNAEKVFRIAKQTIDIQDWNRLIAEGKN